MSSNSSSPATDKNFPNEDSADVPIMTVTAELPMDQTDSVGNQTAHDPGDQASERSDREVNLDAAAGADDLTPAPTRTEPARATDQPGAEPYETASGDTETGSGPALRAEAEEAVLSALSPPGGLGEVATEGSQMPSPFETTSDDVEAVSAGAETAQDDDDRRGGDPEDSPVDDAPDVLTSAVLPGLEGQQVATGLAEMSAAEAEAAMDATDLVVDGDDDESDEAGANAQAEPTPGPQIGAADEDFLRRVVLPPLPRDLRPSGERAAVTDDHTVISAPPSPELLASLAVAPPAPASAPPMAFPQVLPPAPEPRKGGVRLGYLQLGGLLLITLGAGAALPGRIRPLLPPQLASAFLGPAAAPSPVIAPERALNNASVSGSPAAAPAAEAPAAAPAEATAAAVPPAAASKPSAAQAAAGAAAAAPSTAPPAAETPAPAQSAGKVVAGGSRAEASARVAAKPSKAGAGKRARRAKRPVKKAFVDPFE